MSRGVFVLNPSADLTAVVTTLLFLDESACLNFQEEGSHRGRRLCRHRSPLGS